MIQYNIQCINMTEDVPVRIILQRAVQNTSSRQIVRHSAVMEVPVRVHAIDEL